MCAEELGGATEGRTGCQRRLCGDCECIVRQGMARGMMGGRLYSGLRAEKAGDGVA